MMNTKHWWNFFCTILVTVLITAIVQGMDRVRADAPSVAIVLSDTTINATVGQALNINVAAVPLGTPTWNQECQLTSGPTYTWSTSQGSADQTNSASTTVHAKFTNSGQYKIIIGCSIAYTSTCGNYNASGSATVTVNVGPKYSYGISIQGPGGSSIVAANSGAKSSGTVKITVKNPDGTPASGVPAPGLILTNSTGVYVNASASCNGASNSQGVITGTYNASDIVGSVTVAVDDGTGNGPSTSVSQHWNDNGSPWTYSGTFNYNVSSPISYKMTLVDGQSFPLTGHQIAFSTVSESGLEWDPMAGPIVGGVPEGDYVTVTHTGSDLEESYYSGLVTNSGASGASDGTYSGIQTISWDDNFIIDSVTFEVVDNGTFSSAG